MASIEDWDPEADSEHDRPPRAPDGLSIDLRMVHGPSRDVGRVPLPDRDE